MRLLDDFTPIIHELPGCTTKIYAIADVHIGAAEADLDGFERFINRVASEDNAYIVVCGDVINNGIRSANCPTNIYAETMPPQAQVDKAIEMLKPVAHKILGAVSGNHENRTRKAVDLDPMLTIMTHLRIEHLYRRHMAFMRIKLRNGGIHDTYAILLTHGKSENKKKRFDYAIEGVDAIIHGHTHSGLIGKNAKLVLSSNNVVKVKPFISLTATSWLNYGGYASEAMYLPQSTSDPQALVLEWTGSNNKAGTIRTIW